jgi:hypothetical protein
LAGFAALRETNNSRKGAKLAKTLASQQGVMRSIVLDYAAWLVAFA